MSGVGTNPQGGQLSDLEQLQLKSNAVTDESLESTRRMMRLVEESQDAGGKTLEALNDQGEKLDRIEGGLDKINADMKQAQKHLTGMEKWCGLFVCPWNRRKKIKDVNDSIWEEKGDGTVVRKQPGQGSDRSDADKAGPYVQRITNDAREDEMEDNMQAVGSILGNLKSMASDMGNEIEKQNKQLDTIHTKAGGADIMINQATKRTDKLLK